jgi:hypothetical protein
MEEKLNQEPEDAPEREVDPAEDPPPRGNGDVDEERVERDLDDLDRAGAN